MPSRGLSQTNRPLHFSHWDSCRIGQSMISTGNRGSPGKETLWDRDMQAELVLWEDAGYDAYQVGGALSWENLEFSANAKKF